MSRKLRFSQVATVFRGLADIDEYNKDNIHGRWSERDPCIIGLRIGGHNIETIPDKAYLAVEVDGDIYSWRPDGPRGDGPRNVGEAIHEAIRNLLNEEDELNPGPDVCMLQVTGVTEEFDGIGRWIGLKVWVYHLKAEVQIKKSRRHGRPGVSITNLVYL